VKKAATDPFAIPGIMVTHKAWYETTGRRADRLEWGSSDGKRRGRFQRQPLRLTGGQAANTPGLGGVMGGGAYQMTGRVHPVYLPLTFTAHQE